MGGLFYLRNFRGEWCSPTTGGVRVGVPVRFTQAQAELAVEAYKHQGLRMVSEHEFNVEAEHLYQEAAAILSQKALQ